MHSSPVLQIADVVLIGGRMAFTFLAAQGVAVGKTQIETDWLEVGWGRPLAETVQQGSGLFATMQAEATCRQRVIHSCDPQAWALVE